MIIELISPTFIMDGLDLWYFVYFGSIVRTCIENIQIKCFIISLYHLHCWTSIDCIYSGNGKLSIFEHLLIFCMDLIFHKQLQVIEFKWKMMNK